MDKARDEAVDGHGNGLCVREKREGQLERITVNVVGICGELQGLSTASLPHLDEIAPIEVA